MFRKVKKWLGIDGVKIDVDVPEEIFLREKKISGWLIMESKQDSMIQKIRMRLVEKYSRGRGQNRLIDEYELGSILLEGPFYISGETVQKIPFDLQFVPLLSKMDHWESTNILMQGLVKSAKWMRKVSSEYRIEIEADVPGMAVSPLVQKPIDLLI